MNKEIPNLRTLTHIDKSYFMKQTIGERAHFYTVQFMTMAEESIVIVSIALTKCTEIKFADVVVVAVVDFL